MTEKKKLLLISKGLIDKVSGKVKTLSPPAWNGLLSFKGKSDIVYEVWDTDIDEINHRVEDIIGDPNILGGNVGTPHKEPFCNLLIADERCNVEDTAKAIGAVNTYRREENGVSGTITDNEGIIMAMEKNGIDMGSFKDKTVAIIGAGGASLPALEAVMRYNPSVVHVYNRTVEKAERVAKHMSSVYASKGFSYGDNVLAHDLKDIGDAPFQELSLVLNVTKLGMVGEYENGSALTREQLALLPDDAVVFDAVYRSANNSLETPLIRMAKERGLRAVPGHYMLLYQAVKAYEYIFKESLTEEEIGVMHSSMLNSIRGG
ncbi:MAG: hypothetical protein D6769_02865 [Methanobacteriota archaeon]|nr:MAG: hypothetical protein D6769_02865 [Euryarchaeota archaeon]